MNKILKTITLSALIFTSCGGDKKEIEEDTERIVVKVAGNSQSLNTPFVTTSGKIESQKTANVSTRIMGYITKVHVKMGQKVSQGQLLVNINNTDLQAKIAQVDATVLQATAVYNNANKDYERFQNLFAQQSATQKELDDMTYRYEMAKAGLEGAKQMHNEVMSQFSYTNITAPFAGEITNTFIKEGDIANPGMPLVSIEGNGFMQVMTMVSESDITSIKNEMPVIVLVKSTNQQIEGKVSEISSSATNTGGQYLVKINLETADQNVRSGMFVNVRFQNGESKTNNETKKVNMVLVPKSALVTQGQLTGLFTVTADNIAILRWLRIGQSYGDQVEVLSGLSADEKYVISSEGKLYNGVRVQLSN